MVGLKNAGHIALGPDDQADTAVDRAFEHADIGALLGIGWCSQGEDGQQRRPEKGSASGKGGRVMVTSLIRSFSRQ